MATATTLRSDSELVTSWRSRPGSFIALMGLYESNNLRFRQLVRNAPPVAGRWLSQVPGQCDLVLTTQDRGPYTTTYNLTYRLHDEPDSLVPDMTLRLYHDAGLLEAQAWAERHRDERLRFWRSRAERELDQRWARNVMLNRWLEYCIDCGHRFPSPSTERG
jgi:hypothetical protein